MRLLTFKGPIWILGVLVAGASAPLVLIPMISALGWPPAAKLVIAGVAIAIFLHTFMLAPTKLVISDDGLWQRLLLGAGKISWLISENTDFAGCFAQILHMSYTT